MAFVAPLVASIGSSLGSLSFGSILGAGSSILGTVSAVGAANYQKQVAENNSQIAAQNAQRASDQTQQEQLASDRETAALLGSQEAIQGGSGLSLGGASQLRTRRTAQRLGRQDALNIRTAGAQEVQSYLQQSENFKSEADAQGKAKIGALIGGAFDLGSSLVGSAKSSKLASRIEGGKVNRLKFTRAA